MGVTVDEVLVKLTADVGEYNRKVDQSAANFDKRMVQIEAAGFLAGQAIRNAILGAVGAISAQQLVSLAGKALAYASSLGEVAQQIGVTTKELQVFQYAGSQVGLSNDEVRGGLTKLTRTLGEAATGSERAQKALMLVGYSQKELLSGTIKTSDATRKIADFLAKIESPAQRAAVELELFGRAGQKLDTLLAGGSSAITELTKAAEGLGIVLSDEQIQNADKTADKISELNTVLEAKLAAIVSDNAAAIYDFANSIEHLIGQLPDAIRWLQNFKLQLAITESQIAQASPFTTPGAKQEAAARGTAASYQLERNKVAGAIGSMPKFMRDQLLNFYPTGTAQSLGFSAPNLSGGGKIGKTNPALARALAGLNAPAHSKSGAGGDGDREAEKAKREQARYQDALARAHDEELDGLADLYGNIESRYRAEKGRIDEDRKNAARDVAAEEGISDAQRVTLLAEKEKGFVIREAIADQNRFRAIADEAYVAQKASSDAIEEELQARLSLARTAKERRDLERQLLEARKKAELDSLNHTLDTTPTASEEYSNAQTRKGNLNSIYAQKGRQVDRQNMGPWAQYLDGLPKTADDINEALERAAANGAARLNDELAGALSNMLGLHGAAGEFLQDLIKIGLQLAQQALLGGQGGGDGGIGGFLGGIVSGIGGLFGGPSSAARSAAAFSLPGFARGGSMALGGNPGIDQNLLSLNGKPLARVSAGETLNVSPGQRVAGSGGGTIIVAPQHYDLTGVVMTEDLVSALREDNRRYADAVAVAAGRGAVKAAPSEVSRRQRYG